MTQRGVPIIIKITPEIHARMERFADTFLAEFTWRRINRQIDCHRRDYREERESWIGVPEGWRGVDLGGEG